MDKLNKTFQSGQVLTAQEMNQITSKVDEIVDETNNITSSIDSSIQNANQSAEAANSAAESANTAAENANQAVTEIDKKIEGKQDQLVSGENVKTINGETVLGNGNIVINPTIMDLKWTTNVATTRKLVPAELRKKDVKIAYTDNSSVYHVEQYQSEDIDDTSWADDANWKGCRTPLTPMFENAGAHFDDEEGSYEMNGLKGLSENDLFVAWSYPRLIDDPNAKCSFSYFISDKKRKIRTNFPFVTFFRSAKELLLYGQNSLEIFSTASLVKGNTQPFNVSKINTWSCVKLRKFLGIISVLNASSKISTFDNQDLVLLEEIYLRHVKVDVSIFKNSPYIIYDCIKYLIDNASNTKAITVTVHPTTYGYLTGTIEPTEQVGGTTEEWQQIVADAAEKQITFATTE